MRAATVVGALAAAVVAAMPTGFAQEAGKGLPATPPEIYAQVRLRIAEGKHDVAAVFLKAFVDSNPTDQDFLKIEDKYGPSVFKDLSLVRRWSDDPAAQKQAADNVATVLAKSTEATTKVLENPDRVNKFIRNLARTAEEEAFAVDELKRTGDYAVPFMLDALRLSDQPLLTRGILGAIGKLNQSTIGGWVAGLDALPPDLQRSVLAVIVARPDYQELLAGAQSDVRPRLWYAYGKGDNLPALRDLAKTELERVYGNLERRDPADELAAAATPFADHKARYAGGLAADGAAPATVPVWTYDPATQKLTKQPAVATGQADEYFGLRYARWALEVRPESDKAQRLVLGIAAERGVERGKFGDLARTDPAVYKLLSEAPSAVMNDLLDSALATKRTAVVLALTQALGDRADRAAAGALPGRPSRFEQGLTYPDPRVQFAAAHALLRSPVGVKDAGTRGRIVEVLRRAAAADGTAPPKAKTDDPAALVSPARVLLADPDRRRADDTAALFRQLGHQVEVFGTGRDLLRRVAKASDFDLLVVDRHVPDPGVRDLVAHLRADANAARRPVLVVASADQIAPPTVDQLMLRFALLIAATDTDQANVPPPFVPDLRMTPEQQETARKDRQEGRSAAVTTVVKARTARLQRVLDTAGIELSPEQRFIVRLRAELVTWAAAVVEFAVSPVSAPGAYNEFLAVRRQLAVQPLVGEYNRRVGLDHLITLAIRFEQDVAAAPAAAERLAALRRGVDPEALGLAVRPTRDLAAEAATIRQVGHLTAVRVVPEPYTKKGLDLELAAAFQDPADRPRDPAEKKATARVAVGWLARMATGEVPGYDVRPAAAELIGALATDELADAAIDGVARLTSADAQQALVGVALTANRAMPIRVRAADAAARHVQTHGRLVPDSQVNSLVGQSDTEADPDLRGKLLVLKGLLAPNANGFVTGLRGYNPPLVPPPAAPMMPPAP